MALRKKSVAAPTWFVADGNSAAAPELITDTRYSPATELTVPPMNATSEDHANPFPEAGEGKYGSTSQVCARPSYFAFLPRSSGAFSVFSRRS